MRKPTKSRLRRWIEDHLRERITLSGFAFLTALFFTGLGAFLSANNLLFLLLAALLSTLMVSSFLGRIGVAWLELDMQLPDHLCARRPTSARLALRNEKRLLPSYAIRLVGDENSVFSTELYFPLVPPRSTLSAAVSVTFARRGLHTEDSFLISSRFPFGFSERKARVAMKQELLVYPALDPQPGFENLLAEVSGDAETLFRGRGHDFYRIRPYLTNESARHVDWRSTAHTGELQVREFAQEREHLIILFLDLEVPPEHDAWFERAVECCAFLAFRAAEAGARVRFRTQNFELLTPVEGDVYAILRYLALVEPRRRATPLEELVEPGISIVFSAAPRRLQGLGWDSSRVLDPNHWLFATEPSA